MAVKEYKNNHIEVPRFNEANGFYTTKKRSNLMKKIKSKDTKPELLLRKTLWSLGLRYRKNVKKLPGTPDIVFAKKKVAIFIDGEFWHGYKWGLKKKKIKANREFWIPKIERNIQRDIENNQLLKELGWIVIRFWDSDIKNDINYCIDKVVSYLHQDL